MIQELIEGVNIGKLPDPFPFLTNNKIPKVKSSGDLSLEYLELYQKMEKSFLSLREINAGEVVTGVIDSINEKEILVDFGYKDFIYVDKPKKINVSADLKSGDTIDVLVTEIVDNPFLIKGSITELIKQNVHNKMKHYFETKLPLTSTVKSMIPAGYMMNIHMDNITIEAFMPNTLADVNKLSNSQSIMGFTFEVMLETLQQEKGVYVVSRRKYLQSLIPEEIKKLKTGEVYKGEVTGTTPFGVFVQFSASIGGPTCLTGMVHKANIDEYWHDKWNQIVPGMSIEFYVKEVIKNNKIILTQILKESLWDTIKVGKILNGKIRDIKNFGALIELDEETTGLIQTTYINKYSKKLNVGDELKVKVISLIRDDRKIYLNFADIKDRPKSDSKEKEE
jgi:small subunit ribosomal protein S1